AGAPGARTGDGGGAVAVRAAKTRPGLWRGVFVAPLACAAATGGPEACPVAGELPHWQADWCMALLGTDDEIAAWPCIEQGDAAPARRRLQGQAPLQAGPVRMGRRRRHISGHRGGVLA